MTARVESEELVRPGRTGQRVRPRLVGELAVVAALLLAYDRVRSLVAVRPSVAVSHGWAILHTEADLHLRIEGAVNSWLSGQGFLRMLAVDYYQFLHVTVAMAMLAVCYVRRPDVYRPARNALVLTNVVGLVVFALYPAAPPRLLPGAGFVDSVAQAGFGPSHGSVHADQYGAMPSLHLAWATWVAVTGFALVRGRLLRGLLVAYPILTAVVVVATANHYVFDVASGTLLGIVATWVVGVLALGAHPTVVASGVPDGAISSADPPVPASAKVAAPRRDSASPEPRVIRLRADRGEHTG